MVQVRSLHQHSQHGLAQKVPIGGLTTVAPSLGPQGSIVAASQAEGSVYQLQLVPFHQQAAALADLGEFAEALEVAALLPAEVSDKCRCSRCFHHSW